MYVRVKTLFFTPLRAFESHDQAHMNPLFTKCGVQIPKITKDSHWKVQSWSKLHYSCVFYSKELESLSVYYEFPRENQLFSGCMGQDGPSTNIWHQITFQTHIQVILDPLCY